MGLVRDPSWEAILNEQIELSKTAVFEYGKMDCTTWAASIIRSYTNLEWQPSWKNKKEAIRRHSRTPMEEQVTEVLGPPIANILTTQRGDLVQKGLGINSALGICIGRKVAFLYEPEGICYFDLKDCTYSWRI